MRRISMVVVCALLGACGGGGSSSSPGPRLELSGNLQRASSSDALGAAKLALAWYPSFVGLGPTAPPGAIITQPGVTYSGSFPVAFTFTFEGAPPDAALYDLSAEGGTGHLAYGVLLAYEDGDGDGEFGVIGDDGQLVDRVVGTSVPDLSAPPPARSYYVVYLDGTLPKTNYFSAFDLPQGYSLMELRYDFGVEPVPLDTPVAIPITGTDAVNLYACPAEWDGISTAYYHAACGLDPFGGSYRAEGYVYSTSDSASALFYLYDGAGSVTNATVRLDGAELPLTGTYFSDELVTALQGSHSATIAVPGHPGDAISFTMPTVPALSAPANGATVASGSSVTISWSASQDVLFYDVYFLSDDAAGEWLFHTLTTDTAVTTPPIAFSGPAHLTVKAIGAQANGAGNAFLTPVAQDTVAVTFTP